MNFLHTPQIYDSFLLPPRAPACLSLCLYSKYNVQYSDNYEPQEPFLTPFSPFTDPHVSAVSKEYFKYTHFFSPSMPLLGVKSFLAFTLTNMVLQKQPDKPGGKLSNAQHNVQKTLCLIKFVSKFKYFKIPLYRNTKENLHSTNANCQSQSFKLYYIKSLFHILSTVSSWSYRIQQSMCSI